MPQQIEVPGIGVVEFPDGMNDAQIAAAIKANMPDQYSVAPDSAAGKVVSALDWVESKPYVGPFVKGVRDVTKGGAQLLAHGINWAAPSILSDDELRALDNDVRIGERKYQDAREARGDGGLDIGRMVGSAAVTYPVAPIKAATVPAAIGKGAAAGGLLGAMNPVISDEPFLKEKAKQVALGSFAGGAASGIGAGLSRVIKPNTSQEVKALIAEGVTPTPGQILGGGVARFEEKLTSVPVVGDAIKGGQRRALDEFNRAAYNRALKPIGKEAGPEVGRAGVEGVKNALSEAYNELLPNLSFKADAQFSDDIGRLLTLADGMPPEQAGQFQKIMRDQVIGRMTPQGNMSGESLKAVESELSRLARGYRGDPSFSNKQLGSALDEALRAIRAGLERSNPEHAKRLSQINQGFSNYALIRDAAGKVGAQEGVFTPAQLQNAVRNADKTAGKGNFAAGKARMQDLSEAGKTVLGQHYPDSGTAGRMMAGPGIAAGVSAWNPLVGLGFGASMLPYTATGQKLVANLLTKRPAAAGPVAEGLLSVSPALGSVTAGGLLGLYGSSAP